MHVGCLPHTFTACSYSSPVRELSVIPGTYSQKPSILTVTETANALLLSRSGVRCVGGGDAPAPRKSSSQVIATGAIEDSLYHPSDCISGDMRQVCARHGVLSFATHRYHTSGGTPHPRSTGDEAPTRLRYSCSAPSPCTVVIK